MVDYAAEWRRLTKEFDDFPDYHKSLRAYKKDGQWHLMGGASEAHDDARIHYLYSALAKRAAALAGAKTGSLDEWLDLIAAEGPPHETWRGAAVPDTIDGTVPQPDIPAIERLCTVSSDFCLGLEADAFAQVPRSVLEKAGENIHELPRARSSRPFRGGSEDPRHLTSAIPAEAGLVPDGLEQEPPKTGNTMGTPEPQSGEARLEQPAVATTSDQADDTSMSFH